MSVHLSEDIVNLDKQLYQKYLDTFVAKYKRHIAYGTAGFRDHAQYLEHVCFRIGMFQGLFARLDNHKVLGIMITASHNPIQDNGIKVCDFDGTMVRLVLEKQLEKLVVDPCINNALKELLEVLHTLQGYNLNNKGLVFVGRDTRPSNDVLVPLIHKGLQAVGCEFKDVGKVTTPMLHHNVWFFNCFPHNLSRESWVEQFTASYFNTYWTFFDEFMQGVGFKKRENEHVLLDISNGVGGLRIGPFKVALQKYYNFEVLNDHNQDQLNVGCGAEFVHKEQQYPTGFVERLKQFPNLNNVRCVSYDGDSDRIVYFLPNSDFKEIRLMDGDKMISIFALYLQTALKNIEKALNAANATGDVNIQNFKPNTWKIGMVQTPYANGSSTIYLREKLGLDVFFSPNGVKNLHPNAHKNDIGIYCESNGHGTFLVQDYRTEELHQAILQLRQAKPKNEENAKIIHDLLHQAEQLYRYIRIQNQCVGDSITNMLCIEAAMAALNLSHDQYLGLYEDLKCKNTKVVIKDKSQMRVSYAEDRVLQPKELQDKLDAIVASHPGSRAFIRPSGTEDIVRIYAEHKDMQTVDTLCKEIAQMILDDKVVN